MKKFLSVVAVSVSFGTVAVLGTSAKAHAATTDAKNYIYRVYNPNSGEHLYTPSEFEEKTLINFGWKDEGMSWAVPADNNFERPFVTRLYNPNAGDHHYTDSNAEVTNLMKLGWSNDQVGFPAANKDEKGSVPVYRLYNPNAKSGAHHFTLSASERDSLVKVGWKSEGISFNEFAIK